MNKNRQNEQTGQNREHGQSGHNPRDTMEQKDRMME